jgi:hypothetical protein
MCVSVEKLYTIKIKMKYKRMAEVRGVRVGPSLQLALPRATSPLAR